MSRWLVVGVVAACGGGDLTPTERIPGVGSVMTTGLDGDAALALVQGPEPEQIWRWDGAAWVGLVADTDDTVTLGGPFTDPRGGAFVVVRRTDALTSVESYELRRVEDGETVRTVPLPAWLNPIGELSDGTWLVTDGISEVSRIAPGADDVTLWVSDARLGAWAGVILDDDRLLNFANDGLWLYDTAGAGSLIVPCGTLDLCDAPSPGVALVDGEPQLVLQVAVDGGTALRVVRVDVARATLEEIGLISVEVPGESAIVATPQALALAGGAWFGVFGDSSGPGAEGFLMRGRVSGGGGRRIADGLFGVSGLRVGPERVWLFQAGEHAASYVRR